MSNGNKSHTMVTQVQINGDNTVEVSIGVDAFMPGESVELSGYVVQDHGAFATFNEYQTINTRLGETANLMVTAQPAPSSSVFQQGHDVTVLLRASVVWVTVLGEGPAQPSGIAPNKAAPGTVWGRIKGVAAPGSYSDPSEGNQSASAPGESDQESPDSVSISKPG